ncbi:MAG: hypothetical protein HQK88_14085 [Nitrospirae bacterium]|nr:hypothetical protein [Nitrospirota bacterium]MBF0536044.1 hypothetical protein [Nitrospirota bacterium]MBF0617932.1 hypothetical protein [Nitrospirota bacterium]
MNEIIVVLSILGYAAAVKYLMREDMELSLFSAISLVVCLLYAFSLFGALKSGSFIVFGTGMLFLVLALIVITIRLRSDLLLEYFLTPGIATFWVISGLFLFKTRGYTLAFWDEFSHWGLMTKEMYQSGALSVPKGAVTFWYYSPGANLFQYYFTVISGFNEHTLYFAQFVLLFTPVVVFFREFSFKRHTPFIILTTAFFYTLIIVFFQTTVSIMVDQVLGVYFGMALTAYFRGGNKKDTSLLLYVPVLCALTLFKASGLFFAIAVTVIISASFILKNFFDKSSLKLNRTLPVVITLLIFVLSPLITSESWKAHIKHENGGQIPNLIQSSGQSLMDAVRSPKNDDQRTIVSNFFSAIKDKGREIGTFNVKHWFAVFFALFGILFILRSGRRASILWVFSTMTLFFIIYIAGILKVYLFNLGPYEGKLLASFERYSATYLLSFSLLFYGFVQPESIFKCRQDTGGVLSALRQYKLLIFYVFFMAVFFYHYPILKNLNINTAFAHPDYDTKWFRNKISPQINFVKSKTPANSSVFIVFLATTGFEHRVVSYELLPRRFNMGCWSLGKPFFDGDIWTCNITTREWFEQLSSGRYTYVYIATPYDIFWHTYGEAFDNSTKQWSDILFKVNYEKTDGKHFLSPVR